MPTISKERIPFPQKNGDATFLREIKVSAVGTFTISLPPDVTEAINEDTVYGQTRTEVLEKWDDAIRRFHARKAVTTRIIAYDFSVFGSICNDPSNPQRDLLRRRGTGYFRSNDARGLGIALAVGVFDQTEVRDAKQKPTYRYAEVLDQFPRSVRLIDDALNSRDGRKWQAQMPWTEERQRFFLRLVTGMEGLVLDLFSLLDEANETARFADGSKKFLPTHLRLK